MQPYFEFKYIKTEWNSVCWGKAGGGRWRIAVWENWVYI